jgi:hypothetical protein
MTQTRPARAFALRATCLSLLAVTLAILSVTVPTPSARSTAELAAAATPGIVPAVPGPSANLVSSWTNVTVGLQSSPLPRYGAAAAWDGADGEGLVFGGIGPAGAPLRTAWTYANGGWSSATPASPNANNLPSERLGTAMAFDANASYVVLFGGYGGGVQDVLGDTWTFAGGTWTNLTAKLAVTPPARVNASFAYDPALGKLVLFGGRSPTAVFDDTWTFSNGTWASAVAPAPNATNTPPARFGAAMTYDKALGELVLFGGTTANGTVLGDTWAYGSSGWAPLVTHLGPGARSFASFTTLSDGSDVLFGGAGPRILFGDTWTLNGSKWTNLTNSTKPGPGPREGAVAFPVNGRTSSYVVVFGGIRGSSVLNDTWVTGTNATTLTHGNAEPPAFDVNHTSVLTVVAFGPTSTGPLSYSWTGLPTGCRSVNEPTVECTPSETGNYPVVVTATGPKSSANATLSLVVNALPSISSFVVTPYPAIANSGNMTLIVKADGGTGALSYSYTGLPPGCASRNTSALLCPPGSPGSWTVQVVVSDATNVTTTASASVVVDAGPGPGNPWVHRLESPAGITLVLVVVVLVLMVLYGRLRSKKPRPPPKAVPPPIPAAVPTSNPPASPTAPAGGPR